jgi:hypothetical protein
LCSSEHPGLPQKLVNKWYASVSLLACWFCSSAPLGGGANAADSSREVSGKSKGHRSRLGGIAEINSGKLCDNDLW